VRPYLKKPFTKIRLVEWFKVKALSSNTSTTKKKKKSETCFINFFPNGSCLVNTLLMNKYIILAALHLIFTLIKHYGIYFWTACSVSFHGFAMFSTLVISD
jgi:hypothetical protein